MQDTLVVCDFLISYAVSPALLSLPSPSLEEKWRLSDDFVAFYDERGGD